MTKLYDIFKTIKFKGQINIKFFIACFACIITIIPIVGSILKSEIDCDSAYYLCIGEKVAEGCTLYQDLNFLYPPLWVYIEAIFKMLFHIPNGVYWPYLMLYHLFQIGAAYFLYKLITRLGIDKFRAFLIAQLYLLISHWLYGYAVLLDIPSIMLCVLSCWLVLKYSTKSYWHYIWIGSVAACSFLIKQYGLGTYVLCTYLMIFISRTNWKQHLSFFIGYAIPIAICILIWKDTFIHSVILNGYGTKAALDAGYDVSLWSKLTSIMHDINFFCYMVCPIIYIGWTLIPIAYKQKRLPQLIFAYCGILGYSLIFYFQSGQLHYYQYILPFVMLLCCEAILLLKNTKWRYVVYLLLFWTIFVSSYKTYNNRVYKRYICGTERKTQYELASDIKNIVKEGETLFVVHDGLYFLYFAADITPPNLSTIGYSFGPMGLNEKTTEEQIQTADWVIRYVFDFPYASNFTASLAAELNTHPVTYLQNNEILLYKMH